MAVVFSNGEMIRKKDIGDNLEAELRNQLTLKICGQMVYER